MYLIKVESVWEQLAMLLLPKTLPPIVGKIRGILQDVGHKRPSAFALVWLRKKCPGNAIDLSSHVYRYPYLLHSHSSNEN